MTSATMHSAALTIVLLIAATGNYTFFNLLTIVLCIPVLDDRLFAAQALW